MMSLNKILLIACLLIVSVSWVMSDNSSDLPPPPTKPEKFTSKQQLKEYLVKLHEYYAIIGRPRFGRSRHSLMQQVVAPQSAEFYDQTADSSAIPTQLIVELIDQNSDGVTSRDELFSFFKIFNQKF